MAGKKGYMTMKEFVPWAMKLNLSEATREELARAILALREEVEGYEAYARDINEALNQGDGTYRP